MSTLPGRQRAILASDLPQQQKLVLIALSLYVGNNHAAWPTIETLARDCSMSRRRLQSHLCALAGRGIVTSKRRRNQSALRSINWAALEAPLTAHPAQSGSATGGASQRAGSATGGASGSATGGASGSATGGAHKGQGNNKGNDKGCAAKAEESVLAFPVKGNSGEWHLTPAKLAEWQDTFGGVDVLAQCRKALQWLRDNADRQKTARGMTRFLNAWLSRAAKDRAGKQTGGQDREELRLQHNEKRLAEKRAKLAEKAGGTS